MISFLSLTETDVLLSVLDRQWCTPFCHAGFGFRQTLMFLFLSLTDTDVLLSVLDGHKCSPFLSWTTLLFSLLSLTHTDVLLSVLDGHRCSSFCPWQTQLFSCLSLANTDALFSAILCLATDIDVFFLSLADTGVSYCPWQTLMFSIYHCVIGYRQTLMFFFLCFTVVLLSSLLSLSDWL